MSAVCASIVSLTSLSPTVILRGPILSRHWRATLVAKRAKNPTLARGATPRLASAAETMNAALPPGAREKANSQAALGRPRIRMQALGSLGVALSR